MIRSDNIDSRPISRPLDEDSLHEAVELWGLLRQQCPDANDLDLCFSVARANGWDLVETSHLLSHVALLDVSSRRVQADANYRRIRAARLASIHSRIEAALQGERRLDFHAYRVEVIPWVGRVPDDNLDEPVAPGKVVFSWGPDFLSDVVEDPTWLDVALIANEAIEETEAEFQDLEGISETGRTTGAGVPIYELQLRPLPGQEAYAPAD